MGTELSRIRAGRLTLMSAVKLCSTTLTNPVTLEHLPAHLQGAAVSCAQPQPGTCPAYGEKSSKSSDACPETPSLGKQRGGEAPKSQGLQAGALPALPTLSLDGWHLFHLPSRVRMLSGAHPAPYPRTPSLLHLCPHKPPRGSDTLLHPHHLPPQCSPRP